MDSPFHSLDAVIGYYGEPPGTILLQYALGRIVAVTVAVSVGLVMAVTVFPASATDQVGGEVEASVGV